jgi:hypothetical protein
MYRLQATEHSDAGLKLLKKAREQAASAVRAHRDAAIARTNAECAVTRAQLERERQQLAQERAEFARGGQCVIPPWLRDKEVIGGEQGWLHVKLSFQYLVTKFVVPDYSIAGARPRDPVRVVSLEWDAVPGGSPTQVWYWLKLNPTLASYDIGHSYIDRGTPALPHAGHGGFCVAPDGMPPSVRNWDGVIDITARIARAFRVVNLSSLLHTDAVGQPPTRAFRPAGVRQYLEGGFEGPGHQLPGVRVVEHDRPAQVWEQANLPPVAAEAGTTAAAWQAAAEPEEDPADLEEQEETRD